MAPELAALFFREIEKVAEHPSWKAAEKVLALGVLLEKLFGEATKKEQLAFSTLFARISYVGHQFQIDAATLSRTHHFRRACVRTRQGYAVYDSDVSRGIRALSEAVALLCGGEIPQNIRDYFPGGADVPEENNPRLAATLPSIRVVAMADDPENNCLIASDESKDDGQRVRVMYNLPERNDNFNPSIQLIRKIFGFPVTLRLIDVEVRAGGAYRPRAFVIEPDYLFDVSAVSECFKENGAEPLCHLVKKFLPMESTPALLLGNVANHFLDRLLTEPDIDFPSLFRETFQQYPFAYAAMNDREVRELSGKAQKHYVNLKTMAAGGFARQGIDAENAVLEPAFFSETYGLQGRLDLFHRSGSQSAIVELKSGTPFHPNSYGIQRSHFTQTLLYDLLVRSVYGAETDPAKYILYSGLDERPLRFAPTVAPEQWEALQVRNQLLGIERLLMNIRPGDEPVPIFQRLRSSAFSGKGFLQRDILRFEQAYEALSNLERRYFNAFCGFTARENWLSKVGAENAELGHSGHANLWRSTLADKEQAFSILSHLELVDNRANQPDPVVVFRKTEKTNPLANFRVGDIAVLYPAERPDDSALNHQVIKCSITALGPEFVEVQLRSRQFNLKPFETTGSWNLEPDLMDSSFTSMYRGLFEWANAPVAKRKLLLEGSLQDDKGSGLLSRRDLSSCKAPEGLTDEQVQVFRNIVASQHFFLLWGPPGTGKTSVMLRAVAGWVLENTSDNLLLLAYTNRAVDEICEALDSLGGDIRDQYLRIGSRFSTAAPFREQLLSKKVAGVSNRAELRIVLESRRIFVSTVASFAQNETLLKLKKFERLVVDEASQLLEPQLLGLLTRFEHFVLIGDHRQLPAVSSQGPDLTQVADPELQAIGLVDLRDSYFERLYRRCAEKGWDTHFGRLSRQGRMHEDIMHFPNNHFYQQFLQTLVKNGVQHVPCDYHLPEAEMVLETTLASARVAFLPSPPETFVPGQKTHRGEAELVARLVQFYRRLYAANGLLWEPAKTLGIITPWRAQIAQIRAALNACGENPDELSIDTVERYQGGAREIIIISTAVHTEGQLGALVNLSGEGVDRKLNVALTRARKHVVLLGNVSVLEKDPRYKAFMEMYGVEV